jgi:hypothetical protein
MRSILRAGIWLMLFRLTAALPVSAQNWMQWKTAEGGNGHYYALTPVATNWEAAEALAESWGGTLATITSAKEQEFITTTFLNGALEHRPVWIGLSEKASSLKHWGIKLGPVKVEVGDQYKRGFHWVTGEPLKYENWKRGQPDNAGGNEHYVAINWFYSDDPPRGAKGDWNDAPEDGTRGYGGKTDGPYLGLVEREIDPRLPIPWGMKMRRVLSPMKVVLAGLAVVCAGIFVFRSRRKKKL